MATLSPLTTSYLSAPLVPWSAADVAGDDFYNDGRIILLIRNTNATTRAVTVDTGNTAGGINIVNLQFNIAQNQEIVYGPFPPRYWNDSQGKVKITYSGVTDLSVALLRIL